jgi:hypothetical protein
MNHLNNRIKDGVRVSILTIVCGLVDVVHAESSDKQAYHFFRPVPRDLMREMSTDRPDLTESPYTVDAGHVQLEWDFINFSRDLHQPDGGGDRVDTYAVMPVNVKLGLLHNLDLQVVVEPFVVERTDPDGAAGITEKKGFGDITVRLKMNLWGNDGGNTAFGVMPFVKIPTNQDDLGNNAVEGGLILPLSVALPAGWTMGAMTEFDFNENDEDDGYRVDFVNSITFGHGIAGELAGYVEFFTVVSTDDTSDWTGSLGIGFTYGLSDDVQLDAGINIGLTRAADDYNPFAGMSVRF